jgi:hypothetical protein
VGTPRTTVHSASDIITAIRGSAGIKTTIAKRLNVARQTIDSYIERYPTVREAYQTEKAGIDDAAQSVVINDILRNKSVETAKWWLKVKMPDEFNPPAAVDVSHKGEIEHKGKVEHAISGETATTIFDILTAAGLFDAAPDDAKDDEIYTAHANT